MMDNLSCGAKHVWDLKFELQAGACQPARFELYRSGRPRPFVLGPLSPACELERAEIAMDLSQKIFQKK